MRGLTLGPRTLSILPPSVFEPEALGITHSRFGKTSLETVSLDMRKEAVGTYTTVSTSYAVAVAVGQSLA